MIDWDVEWRHARERSPLTVTPETKEKWRAFWSKDANGYLEDVKAERALYERVVQRLINEGWVLNDDSLLDIGSGPGTFAIPFSRHVRSVTALDDADGMLAALRKECAAQGIRNIKTLHCGWGEHTMEGLYDLTFAALSPAVRSSNDLMDMEKASRSRCCYITACPSDWMGLRNELWEKVVGGFVSGDASSVRYPLNILLESRRSPELFRVRAETETHNLVQAVVDHYVNYFSIFTEMTPRKVEIVRDHITSRSHDGTYTSRGTKCLYMLCWEKRMGTER